MAELRWAKYPEKAVGAGNLEGKPDTMNRAAMDFFFLFTKAHNYSDGTHAVTDLLQLELYSYTGTGIAHTESLTNTSLEIRGILLTRADTENPILRTSDMTGTDSKELNTNAFQANMITDISTAGEFDLGTDVAVNENLIDYEAIVLGVVS